MDILNDFGVNWQILLVSVVNFTVLAVILWFILMRPLLALLEKREVTIRLALERAELEQREAKIMEEEREKQRTAAVEEAKQIVIDASTRANTIVAKAETVADRKATEMMAVAQTKLENERDELMEEATQQLADVVVDATKLVIGKTMSKELDRDVINDTLKSMKQPRT